jgi:hypothetical protein
MAFLDNGGDIILDAVLTDTGRKRLAQGDGSFRIAKFALGDDEINYNLYNQNHSSGSAYYDLEIMQTPILEAFTDNAISLKNKLISYTRSDLLYLPVIKLNPNLGAGRPVVNATSLGETDIPNGGYIITADEFTSTLGNFNSSLSLIDAPGIIRGGQGIELLQIIGFDQGLNSPDLNVRNMEVGDPLIETQYIVEIDSRLGQLYTTTSYNSLARPSYIDDDNVASYYFSLNSNSAYFAPPLGQAPNSALGEYKTNNDGNGDSLAVIGNGSTTGRYGTRFGFGIKATLDLNSSNTLFTKLGALTATGYLGEGSKQFYYIDTTVRVTGFTTGYRVDIPLRFLKYKA